jgi:activator of HSP90 ATPase
MDELKPKLDEASIALASAMNDTYDFYEEFRAAFETAVPFLREQTVPSIQRVLQAWYDCNKQRKKRDALKACVLLSR